MSRPPPSCPQCGARFGTARAANSHRAGEWGDPVFPRRCRTEAEMLAGGMWRTGRGVWHGEWTATTTPAAPANAWQGRASGGRGDAP